MNETVVKTRKEEGTEYWKVVVVIFCLGWTVLWIHRTILNPILPEIKLSLNIGTDAAAGLITSLFFLPYTLLQVPIGFIGDKFGRKLVLITGLIMFSFGSIAAGISFTFMMFLATRVVTGIGQAAYFGPVYSLSSEVIPKEKRGVSTAIINSGTALGMAIGLIASSYLVKDAHWSWRTLLFISGGLGVVMTVVFKIFLKGKPQKSTNIKQEIAPEEKSSMKELLSNPQMIGASIMYFATCYGYYMIVTWLPAFLEKERGFHGAAIGLASSVIAFSSVPGALIFSKVSDIFMNKKVTLIVLLEVLSAITLYLTVVVKSSSLLITCLVIYGIIGKLAVDPILVSHLADFAPKSSSTTAFALYNFFGMSASIFAPYITGMISDVTGSKVTAFYLASIIIIVAIFAMLLCNKVNRAKNFTLKQ